MTYARTQTKAEQEAEILRERAHWENHVVAIFSGFLGSVVVLMLVISAIAFWLYRLGMI